MTKQKIIKTGHSLAVTVPFEFAQSLGIKAGQEVEVMIEPETGKITYTFTSNKQLSLSGSFIKRVK